jgi:hypothetical protein
VIFAFLLQTVSSLPTDSSALESAISALESEISALDKDVNILANSSLPWEHSGLWFTLIVAFGVAMELCVILHEWRDDMKSWSRGIIRPPDCPSACKLWMEFGSVLFIVAGIMGEFGAGLKIASINKALRSKNELLQSKGAELRSKSDQLVAGLGRESEALKKQAEDERWARVELWQKIEPRSIPKGDSKTLADSLSEFGPSLKTTPVKVFFNVTDPEALVFAYQLQIVLRDAGIKSIPGPYFSNGPPQMGLVITGPPSTADFIKKFVEGLPVHIRGNRLVSKTSSAYPNEVDIRVEMKPIAGLPKNVFNTHVIP